MRKSVVRIAAHDMAKIEGDFVGGWVVTAETLTANFRCEMSASGRLKPSVKLGMQTDAWSLVLDSRLEF